MNTHFRDERGFTLVELAVVMVIIGLLIGGILKGQEMIENARVNSTISQIKAIDAASSTFQDMYDAIAGDMIDASIRLPGGLGDGDGNNRLVDAPFNAFTANDENVDFFLHLDAADLLVGTIGQEGGIEADIKGTELTIGEHPNGALGQNGTARSGRYVVAAEDGDPTTASLRASEAGRIDRKLDDGDGSTGSVVTSEAACVIAGAGADNVYPEADDSINCSIAVRVN